MGVYDTLVDGDQSVQVKCFSCDLATYYVDDFIASAPHADMTVVCPDYRVYPQEGKIFALLKDRRFVGFTHDPEETYPPYIDKWGNCLATEEDFKDHFRVLVEEIARTVERESQ